MKPINRFFFQTVAHATSGGSVEERSTHPLLHARAHCSVIVHESGFGLETRFNTEKIFFTHLRIESISTGLWIRLRLEHHGKD